VARHTGSTPLRPGRSRSAEGDGHSPHHFPLRHQPLLRGVFGSCPQAGASVPLGPKRSKVENHWSVTTEAFFISMGFKGMTPLLPKCQATCSNLIGTVSSAVKPNGFSIPVQVTGRPCIKNVGVGMMLEGHNAIEVLPRARSRIPGSHSTSSGSPHRR
jgi:hypothetical protein